MNKGCLQTIALLYLSLETLKYHLVFHHLCLYLQLFPLWDENSPRQGITFAASMSCNISLSNQEIMAFCCLSLGQIVIIHFKQQIQPPPHKEDSKTINACVKLEQWLCSFSRQCFHLLITYHAIWGGTFNGINIHSKV